MTPTPEQVAQWAREAGAMEYPQFKAKPMVQLSAEQLHRLVTRAMAEQAEADASAVRFADNGTEAAEIIRANAPKVTT